MPRTHDRTDFYKFATLDVAKIMIERRTLRWRTPLQFNDPFDTQTRLISEVDESVFAHRFVERLSALSFDSVLPDYFDPNSKLHRAAMYTRENAQPEQREAFSEFMRKSAAEAGRRIPKTLAEFSDEIAGNLQHSRIFCMTEDVNNVVMWSHYADEHRGVGFKFRVLDEIDHPFLMARKVNYSAAYLSAGDSLTLADHFSRAKPIDLAALCWDLVYLKHDDWTYEKEWRAYKPLIGGPVGTGYEDMAQNPRLFEAIYLGCRMVDPQTTEIVEFIREHLPETEIYQARKSRASFDLEFDRVA